MLNPARGYHNYDTAVKSFPTAAFFGKNIFRLKYYQVELNIISLNESTMFICYLCESFQYYLFNLGSGVYFNVYLLCQTKIQA